MDRSKLPKLMQTLEKDLTVEKDLRDEIYKDVLAEIEWSKIVVKKPISSDEDIYKLWAKERRKLFSRWGNLPTWGWDNVRLRSLKDKFKGERIFILGNGPSLNKIDFSKLISEFTFAVNRIYLIFDRTPWRPTFYTINDWEVGPDNAKEINALDDKIIKFIPKRFKGLFEGKNLYYYNSRHNIPPEKHFSYDLERGAVMGGTVLTLPIQIAYHMGFEEIYLIGVDANFTIRDTVSQSGTRESIDGVKQFLMSTKDDDPNHFDPRYFGKNKRWHHPEMNVMIAGFTHCKEAIELKGRKIYNATIGGKLEVMKRVNFFKLFDDNVDNNKEGKKLSRLERKKLISIIMPAYNASKYIEESIRSVLDQSYPNWELLITNDASTDNTLEIIRKFKDDRIRLISLETNKGRSGARNTSLQEARGAYVSFLDSDDLYEKDALKNLLDFLENNKNCDAVVGKWERFDTFGNLSKASQHKSKKNDIIDKHNFLFGNPTHPSTVLVKMDSIPSGHLFNENAKAGEDWEYFAILGVNGFKFAIYDGVVSYYRMTDQAVTKTTLLYAKNMISVLDRIFDSISDKKSSLFNQREEAYYQVTAKMACRLYAVGNFIDGRTLLEKCLKKISAYKKCHFNIIEMSLSLWIRHLSVPNPHGTLFVATRMMPPPVDQNSLYSACYRRLKDKLAACPMRVIDFLYETISKICAHEEKLSRIFSKAVLEHIKREPDLIENICNDRCIQEIMRGDDVLLQILNDRVMNSICANEEIYLKLCNYDLINGIKANDDLILRICSNQMVSKIFGSIYNSRSRTDKFYGFFGRLFAAYKINKAVKEWEQVDRPKLESLRGKHKGKRGFVVCNGPSLNKIDFSKLENEITIGSNGIFLNYRETGFLPDYYVVEDDLVGEDRKNELNQLQGTIKLFAQRLAYCLYRDEDVIYLNHTPDSFLFQKENQCIDLDMRFSPDISISSYGGHTVTYTCLQVAYHLGLEEVYIIGADHNYAVPDRYSAKDANDNYIIESQENDSNHFNKDYFGKGFRWHNPKVHKLEEAYTNAKKFYEYHGRKIYNATIGGHLEVFERVDFYDLFKDKKNKQPAIETHAPVDISGKPACDKFTSTKADDNKKHTSNVNSLFVVGNGPSLRNFNFKNLEEVEWVGMNAAYRFWEKAGVYPNYYICLDTVVTRSHKDKIYELIQNRKQFGIELFFLRNTLLQFYPDLSKIPEVVFFEDYLDSPYFEGIKSDLTTGSFATLFGAMLGYKLMYLLGIDLNYVQQIPEAKKMGGYVLEINQTPKSNPNYFFDDYQQKGDQYNLPYSSAPDLHYKSWTIVRHRLKKFGVHVFNCNPDSEVDLFNFADINKILS
jgi:glycosyltransferase involved in cell wall biosynthesis